jgi:uncharacterized protein YjdB
MGAVAMVGCEIPVATDPAGTVVQLQISPKTSALRTGQMTQFTVIGLTKTGDTAIVAVSWSVTGGAVVDTSSSGGKHYGQYRSPGSPGRYKVVAKSDTLTDSAVVDVSPVPVAAVAVTPASASVARGQTAQLTATTLDSTGAALSGRTVTWVSSNTAVATVNGSGLVTGLAAGAATITATSDGKNGTAVITVTVTPVPVASVSVSPASASVTAGQTVQLTATPRDANGTALTGRVVTWSSGNTAVATVSGSGLVTAVAAGSATITATSEGQSGSSAITVTQTPAPVASVGVTPASASVTAGQTAQLTATPRDANGIALAGRVVTWSSSNTAVATVSGSGLVTGGAAGSATITATSEGQGETAAITVTAVVTNPGTVANLAVAGVTVNSATLSFTEVNDGAGLPASYLVRFAVAPLSWGSATDVSQGSCAVPLAGTTIGATRSCTVLGLAPGTSYQFQLIAFRGTLNVNAVFGALSSVVSGTTSMSTAPVASVTLSPGSARVTVGTTQQLTATLKDASGGTLTGRTVTWASSAPLVATVSGSGLVNGLLVGTVTITATSEGQSGTAAITVAVGSGGGSGAWAHEPAGFTTLLRQPWTSMVPPMTDMLTGNHALVTNQTDAPISAPSAIDFWYPAGLLAGYEDIGPLWYDLPRVGKELFVGVSFKLSSNFQGEASGVQKILFFSSHGDRGDDFWLEVGGSGSGPLNLRVVTEFNGLPSEIYEPSMTHWATTLVAGETDVPIARGVWHRYEVYLKLPTVSGGPGTCKIWVDGVLALNRDPSLPAASQLPMTFANGWFQVWVDPIWGGGQSIKTQRDDIWLDDLYVSAP